MKYAMLIAAVLVLAVACVKEPLTVEQTDNGAFDLQKLFTHDGCTVYRFKDKRYVYYTDCRGRTSSSYSSSCGKNCTSTRHTEVETLE